jgi:mannitol/fructose-specific phosphotransferase system IIA component (Ntr-type)
VGFSALQLISAPLAELAASVFLGGLAGLALRLATLRVVRPERLTTASVIALLATVGLADFLGVSALLACMFLGITLANVAPEKEGVGHVVFADFESAIYAVFFVLAGMELELRYLLSTGFLAMLLVVARLLGKLISARVAMRLAGATDRVRRYLGLALIPQAGVAVGLILLVQEDPVLAPIHQMLLAVGLSSVTLNEIVGPVLTRASLVRSGDLGKDRARLIDFLLEEHIVTDLKAETKEQAIERLTDLLISSHHLKVNRGELLESILARESDMSTCVGGGLAVPHAVLERGSAIVGVMGISREGLAFDTPDGFPVHCMVLMATPSHQRERHLEVLAALARAIGSDRNIQLQLYNASSPAHAYEILHAEEFEDFNYFLEDVGAA